MGDDVVVAAAAVSVPHEDVIAGLGHGLAHAGESMYDSLLLFASRWCICLARRSSAVATSSLRCGLSIPFIDGQTIGPVLHRKNLCVPSK